MRRGLSIAFAIAFAAAAARAEAAFAPAEADPIRSVAVSVSDPNPSRPVSVSDPNPIGSDPIGPDRLVPDRIGSESDTATDTDTESPPPVFRDEPKRLPPLFWYENDPDRRSSFFMLMMLWWQADNPERRFQCFFPLYYLREHKATQARTIASPLFYGWRSPKGHAAYVPPVYVERSEGIRRVGVPPLFWYGRVGTGTTSYLAPFYFFDERDGRRVLATPIGGGWGTQDDWQGVVGLYYWRHARSATAQLDAHVLFPLFWHVGRPGRSTWALGPIFHTARQTRAGTKHAYGLPPLFYRRTSPGGGSTTVTPLSVFERRDEKRAFLVTPLGGYATAPGRATVLAGPWFERFADGVRSRALIPLFYHRREGRDVRFVSPGVVFHREADGDLRGLFGPLYHVSTAAGRTWFLIPGIWRHEARGRGRGYGALPFYRWTSDDGASYAGLVPLYFYRNRIGDDGKRRRFATLLPLFWFREGPGTLDLLSPVYAQIRRPGGDRRVMAAWLWWDHRAPGYRNLTLFPLFHWDRHGGGRRLVTPIGGFARERDRSTSLWGPFYRHRDPENAADVVFPLFWRLRSPDAQTVVAGPYYRTRQGAYFAEGIFPLWFHTAYPGAAQSVVFPLFLYRVDRVERSRTLFTPIGGYSRNDRDRTFRLLAPLVYRESGPHRRVSVLFPLFWYHYDHGRQTVVVPPFFTRRTDRTLRVGTIPLFYYSRVPRSTFFVSLPGILHFRDDDDRATFVAPLLSLWSRTPRTTFGFVGPFVWDRNFETDDHVRALIPVLYHRRHRDRSVLLTPLLFHRHDTRRSTTILPGMAYASRRRGGEVVSRAAWVGPLYLRVAPRAADAVLFPFLFHAHGRSRSSTALAPIFFRTRDEAGSSTTLLPLFHHARSGDRWRLLTLAGGGGSDPALDTSWWWVLNAIHARAGDRSRTAVIPLAFVDASPRRRVVASPLFFDAVDRERGERTTLLPLFYRRASEERSTWVAFPLAWSHRERGLTRGGILPFAFWRRSKELSWTAVPLLFTYAERRGDDHLALYGPLVDVKLGGRRTVALFPVFRYHRDEAGSSFASLPFLIWMKRDGHTRGFVGFGYWNGETGTRVFPPYFRFQRKDGEGRERRTVELLVPGYVRYRTPAKEIVVVPPFYRVRRADGTRVHGIAPFWNEELGRGRHSWSVLGDLVGYQRVGPHRRLTLLFGFHVPMKSLPAKRVRSGRASPPVFANGVAATNAALAAP